MIQLLQQQLLCRRKPFPSSHCLPGPACLPRHLSWHHLTSLGEPGRLEHIYVRIRSQHHPLVRVWGASGTPSTSAWVSSKASVEVNLEGRSVTWGMDDVPKFLYSPGRETRASDLQYVGFWCVLECVSSPCLPFGLLPGARGIPLHQGTAPVFPKPAISYHFRCPIGLQGHLSAPHPGLWTGVKNSSLLLTIHNAHVSSTNMSNVSHGESFIRIDWLSSVQTFVEH